MAPPPHDTQQRTGNVQRSPKEGPGAPGQGGAPPVMPPRRTWLTFLIILAINFVIFRVLFPGRETAVQVPYTLFKQEVTKRNVTRIYSRGEKVTGRFVSPVRYPAVADT